MKCFYVLKSIDLCHISPYIFYFIFLFIFIYIYFLWYCNCPKIQTIYSLLLLFIQLFLNILSGMANSIDWSDWSGSTLFAYAVLSESLVYEILGNLPYSLILLWCSFLWMPRVQETYIRVIFLYRGLCFSREPYIRSGENFEKFLFYVVQNLFEMSPVLEVRTYCSVSQEYHLLLLENQHTW